jgi:hypothetical protein
VITRFVGLLRSVFALSPESQPAVEGEALCGDEDINVCDACIAVLSEILEDAA